MNTSTIQAIKLAIANATGLSKDALHVYAGLTVFVLSGWILRKPLTSVIPLLLVFGLAFFGEFFDLLDDVSGGGSWRWRASLNDVFNTAFWPVVFFVLARWTSSFRAPR